MAKAQELNLDGGMKRRVYRKQAEPAKEQQAPKRRTSRLTGIDRRLKRDSTDQIIREAC